MSLALTSESQQLRVSFTFEWLGGVLMELKIEGKAAPGNGPHYGLKEVYRMLDNLRYSESTFASCAECDRHQVLAIIRRSIDRANLSTGLANISVSIKDENGATKQIAISEGSDTMVELEKMLRSVSAAHPGHSHGAPSQATPGSKGLSVH